MNAFSVVEQFERRIAEYCGAAECVSVSTGTNAILLALLLERERMQAALAGTSAEWAPPRILCPARTFIGVPMVIKHVGFRLKLIEQKWLFSYALSPTRVVDAALDFREGVHRAGDLTCLSFQARKTLKIGEGGAILCDDKVEADWLRAARYCGRRGPLYRIEDVTMLGLNCYMTPEKAARGLHLMEFMRDTHTQLPASAMRYPDLRDAPVFKSDL